MPNQYASAKLSLDSLPSRLNYNLLNATLIFCLVLFDIMVRRLIFVQCTLMCRFDFITIYFATVYLQKISNLFLIIMLQSFYEVLYSFKIFFYNDCRMKFNLEKQSLFFFYES